MSDDLEGVAYVTRSIEEASPAAIDLSRRLAERDARQTELEGLIADLEGVLESLRGWAVRMRQTDEEELPEGADSAARRGAEARAQDAEFRLQRSVDTNIGRQRTIQKLRERVAELEQALAVPRKDRK